MRLIYVMDPMCAWCFGFQPELDALLGKYADACVDWIMGGLAPDADKPMDDNLRQTIASYWYQIESASQVTFNHDYWQLNTPYRSTYPACRAVIAAESLVENSAQKMVKAIQSAYYREAKNPSLRQTLIDCAASIGIDRAQFAAALTAQETAQRFEQHLAVSRQLGVRGFPALFYVDNDNRAYPVTLGFCQTAQLEQRLQQLMPSQGL